MPERDPRADPRADPRKDDTWISGATKQEIVVSYVDPPWMGLDWAGKPCQTTIHHFGYISRNWTLKAGHE